MPKLKFLLKCFDCSRIGYLSRKNPKNDPDKLEFMKYCKWCKKKCLHKEHKVK